MKFRNMLGVHVTIFVLLSCNGGMSLDFSEDDMSTVTNTINQPVSLPAISSREAGGMSLDFLDDTSTATNTINQEPLSLPAIYSREVVNEDEKKLEGYYQNPQLTMPMCPCERDSEDCLDVHFCYCQLGYQLPLSQVTGKPFLNDRLQDCKEDYSTNSSKFHNLPQLVQYEQAFNLVEWECQLLPSRQGIQITLHPFLCIWWSMIPFKGSFRETFGPTTLRSQFPNLGIFRTDKNKGPSFWSNSINRYIEPDDELTENSKMNNSNDNGNAMNDVPQNPERDDGTSNTGIMFNVSGGRACFESMGLYRRGISAAYDCWIHFLPNPDDICTSTKIAMTMVGWKLINLQIHEITLVYPNGSIALNPLGGKRTVVVILNTSSPTDKENETKRQTGQGPKVIDLCSKVLKGFNVKFLYYKQDLLQIQLIRKFGDILIEQSNQLLPVQFNFEFIEVEHKYFSKQSRFWYDILNGDCPEQTCWRDLFNFPNEHGRDEGHDWNFDRVLFYISIGILGSLLVTYTLHTRHLEY